MGQQIAVRGVDVDDVEARALGAQRCVLVPAARLLDVGLVHGAGLIRTADQVGQRGDVERHLARPEVGHARAAQAEFDARQRAFGMDHLGHQRVRANVALVPEGRHGKGRVLARRMDRAVFGVDHAPAALGLHAAQMGQGARAQVAAAGAVRHLIEAVLGRHRPDLDRFEEDIVAWIAAHGFTCNPLAPARSSGA